MGSNTPNLSLFKPAEGEDGWADEVNNSFDTLDSAYVKTITTQTADYTAELFDVVLVDASSGNITITLPSPDTDVQVNVKKIDSSSNTVTIATPNSETIDGGANFIIGNQYDSFEFVSDGSNYFIV